MTASTTTEERTRYLEAVREELDDLPEEERTDLLEDLGLHLAEVSAERGADDPPLTSLLGPPARYAAELRAAAGLPPRNAGARDQKSVIARLRGLAAVQFARKCLRHPTALHVRNFIPQLRPAWWVLRGWLVIAIPALAKPNSSDDFPVPTVAGSHLVGFAVTVLAITASVAVGQRPWRKGRWLVYAGNLLCVALAVMLFANAESRLANRQPSAPPYAAPRPVLSSQHGPVTNIFPYSSDGAPLSDILLFDQDGRPLRTDTQLWWADRCQRLARHPRAADGVPVEFSYPKRYELTGATPGEVCRQEPYRPTVPLPAFGPSPADLPSPSPIS